MTDALTPPDLLKTAVLFLVFNRPDTTARVFEAIRKAMPQRLYVAADGPRANREGEAATVAKVRQIATAVDWPCEVKTLFREENLGCKRAVSEAITWFFENEEQGIILEDDCLPHHDFFSWCEILLNRYAYNDRVWVITGNNIQHGAWRGEASYYFSRYIHVWGWASWRRAWRKSDMAIAFWPEWKESEMWKISWDDVVARAYWDRIFDRTYRAEIDTWDYSWMASVWYHGGLTATPNVNLVSNIGFGKDATHTVLDGPLADMPTHALGEIYHPSTVNRDTRADHYAFNQIIGGFGKRYLVFSILILHHIVGYLSRFFK